MRKDKNKSIDESSCQRKLPAIYKKDSEMLKLIIDQSAELPPAEKEYRKNNVCKACDQIVKKGEAHRYYELAHEIRTLEYLKKKSGVLTVSNDSKHKSGADFIYNDIYIECVTSSKGESGFDEYNGLNQIVDYSKKKDIALTRITNSISSKKRAYKKQTDNGSIPKKSPYVIFLSCGEMSADAFFTTENGIDFAGILFGINKPYFVYDPESEIAKFSGYTIRKSVVKDNNSSVDVRLFADEENAFISAIIFTAPELCEKYSWRDTFLFINPLANHPICIEGFSEIDCWVVNDHRELVLIEHQ